jgi:hypothetical protein
MAIRADTARTRESKDFRKKIDIHTPKKIVP